MKRKKSNGTCEEHTLCHVKSNDTTHCLQPPFVQQQLLASHCMIIKEGEEELREELTLKITLIELQGRQHILNELPQSKSTQV